LVKALQFEVYRVAGLRPGSLVDLAIVLPDDALSHLATRLVAPLVEMDPMAAIQRLTPAVEIAGTPYLIAMHLMATVPVRNLATLVTSLADQERQIKNAIDTLFFGV
jgi:toxin CcdB